MKRCFIKNSIQMANKYAEMLSTAPRKCDFEPKVRFDYIL